jgi:sugar/nucleoside kinase (ribokinase family)
MRVKISNAHELDRKEIRAFAEHCLALGVKCVYVTLDSRGCLTYFKKRGKVVEELVPSIKVEKVIDTTGCGDSFAGGLVVWTWYKTLAIILGPRSMPMHLVLCAHKAKRSKYLNH